MHGGAIGEIFFHPFDGFEDTCFGGRVLEVGGRVGGDLLGEVDIAKVFPATFAFVEREITLDEIGDDFHTEIFDAGDDGSGLFGLGPFAFEWVEEMIDQFLLSRDDITVLGFAEVVKFLEGQEGEGRALDAFKEG